MNSVRNVACCVCGSVQHLGGADGAGKMWKLPGVVYGKARGVYRGVRGGGVAIGGGGGGGGGDINEGLSTPWCSAHGGVYGNVRYREVYC